MIVHVLEPNNNGQSCKSLSAIVVRDGRLIQNLVEHFSPKIYNNMHEHE